MSDEEKARRQDPQRCGIPTFYNGTQFRSRLEARWAAMFDLLEWKWVYEPFDLNGYIPDFVMNGWRAKLIVEVKPALTMEDLRMAIPKIAASGWDGDALIVGASVPFRSSEGEIGILSQRDGSVTIDDFAPALIAWGSDEGSCRNSRCLIHSHGGWRCYRCRGGGEHIPSSDLEALWRAAGNAVQWSVQQRRGA